MSTTMNPFTISWSKREAKAAKDDPADAGIPGQIERWSRQLYLIHHRKFKLAPPKVYWGVYV
jgi:hypothetical protein